MVVADQSRCQGEEVLSRRRRCDEAPGWTQGARSFAEGVFEHREQAVIGRDQRNGESLTWVRAGIVQSDSASYPISSKKDGSE